MITSDIAIVPLCKEHYEKTVALIKGGNGKVDWNGQTDYTAYEIDWLLQTFTKSA